MNTKKVVLSVLFVGIVLLLGCHQTKDPTESFPPLYDGITYYSDCALILQEGPHGMYMDFYEEPYEEAESKTTDLFWDDSSLQNAVKEKMQGLVLDNDDTILEYAWNLQAISQEHAYIPVDYFPYSAQTYSNGVVEIIYLGNEHIDYMNDISEHWGEHLCTEVHVYVSASDGHVIHYF